MNTNINIQSDNWTWLLRKTIVSIISLLTVFMISMHAHAEDTSSLCPFLLQINFESNLILDKKDVDVYWDNNKIATLPHGQSFQTFMRVPKGQHQLVVRLIDNAEAAHTVNFTINEESTYTCTIRTHRKSIDLEKNRYINNADEIKLQVNDVRMVLLSEALSSLRDTGFSSIRHTPIENEKEDEWIVISQSPDQGSKIFSDDPIELTCEKLTTFTENNFIGKSLAEAEQNAKNTQAPVQYRLITREETNYNTVSELIKQTSIEKWIVKDAEYQSGFVLTTDYLGQLSVPDLFAVNSAKAEELFINNGIYNYDFDYDKEKLKDSIIIGQNYQEGTVIGNHEEPIMITTLPFSDMTKLSAGLAGTKEYPDILSKYSSEELASVLSVEDSTDTSIESFFSEHEDEWIVLKANVVCKYSNAFEDGQQIILLRTGAYNQYSVDGPVFQIATSSGSSLPTEPYRGDTSLKEGATIEVFAQVGEYDNESDVQEIIPFYIRITDKTSVDKDTENYNSNATAKNLQTALNRAGYNCGTPDGIVGNHTRQAISSYKEDHKMGSDSDITFPLLASLGVKVESDPKVIAPAPAPAPAVESSRSQTRSNTSSGEMVWISSHGSKYHRRSTCSNMKDPWQVTREEAESRGREPCKKCY